MGAPTVKIPSPPRSVCDLRRHCPTTLNVGELIPFPPKEVLPGDSWKGHVKWLCRLQSSFKLPLMADLYLDTATFFVPLRLLYDDFAKVFIDPSTSGYTSPNSYTIPVITGMTSGQTMPAKTVGTYLGLHAGLPHSVLNGLSRLPFRAFAKIYDCYYRPQQVEDPMFIYTDDSLSSQSNERPNNLVWNSTNYFGQLPHPSRYPDLFSTLTLTPERGPAVPVIPADYLSNMWITGASGDSYMGTPGFTASSDLSWSWLTDDYTGQAAHLREGVPYTMDDFTVARNVQKFLDRTGKFGTDYWNYLLGAYGINNPAARLDRPELICLDHQRLNIQQVAQTANDSGSDDVGKLGAFSQTGNNGMHFSRTFTEHGYLMRVASIRYVHLYPDGFDTLWKKKARFDFYDPAFAFMPPQAVEKYIAFGNNSQVLGYSDAWFDYRQCVNRATGAFADSSGLGQYWTLADFYNSAPNIYDFRYETATRFNSVISDSSVDQFVLDWFESDSAVRNLPEYSD